MILSIIISLISIIVGAGVIFYYGSGNGLVGSAWILSILGAPLTFLYPVILRLGLFKNNFLFPYVVIYSLFFLQYLLLAYIVYKLQGKVSIKASILVFIIILISASIMFYFQIGRYSH